MGLVHAVGCSSPGYDVAQGTVLNSLGKSAILDIVYSALNSWDCVGAYTQLYPVYNSSNTDNDIRLAMASVYGCYAGVNVLTVMNNMATLGFNFAGSGFFEFMAMQFPSTSSPDDKKVTAAENGTDALMATLKTGTILVTADTVNSTSNNPGSIIVNDRIDDANTYMTFISMALIGTLENRYASPNSTTYHKSNSLPWTSASLTPGDGCAFASALLNMTDSISFISSVSPSSVASKFSSIQSLLSSGLSTACNLGCAACGLSCSSCPTTLRSRASCTGSTSDTNSCAAAGIIQFMVNATWSGPP